MQNKEILGYLEGEHETRQQLSVLANRLCRKLSNDTVKVFIQKEDNKLKIYCQNLGMIFNSGIFKTHELEMMEVKQYDEKQNVEPVNQTM